MVTTIPSDGATLQFVCTFRYIFTQIQVSLRRFVWYLNRSRLSTAVNSRRIMIDMTEPDLTGTWTSTLTFNPAKASDSGNYSIDDSSSS